MKAAQLVAPRKWELIEVEKPQASDGNMLVRTERAAICGTDLPFYSGLRPSYPLSLGEPGHEGMGVVESCPSGRFAAGDRVLLSGFDRGLYQEYVLARDEVCVPLPVDIDPEVVLMSQLLGTVLHCFFKLGNLMGNKAVVVGLGAVGQLFCATLRNLGAARIIAVDPLQYRLDLSRRMGATHTLNPNEGDLSEAVLELTGGQGADMVVEAVGREETINLCPELARRDGTVVYFGVPDKDGVETSAKLAIMPGFVKSLTLVTSVGPDPLRDYTMALDWITQGRIDVRPILTHILPFEQIQEAFEMAFDRPAESEALKIVLKF